MKTFAVIFFYSAPDLRGVEQHLEWLGIPETQYPHTLIIGTDRTTNIPQNEGINIAGATHLTNTLSMTVEHLKEIQEEERERRSSLFDFLEDGVKA